jgi:hypothetical protein
MTVTTTEANIVHFVSRNHAITYYKQYGIKKDQVKAKIEACEINIGAPTLKKHEKLSVDGDGRYIIIYE